jgi:hypothetical protein
MLKPWWEQPDAHDRAVKFHNRLQVLGTAVGLGLAGYGVHKLVEHMNSPKLPRKLYIDWPRVREAERKALLSGGPGKTGWASVDKQRELMNTPGLNYLEHHHEVEAIDPKQRSVYSLKELEPFRTSEVELPDE